MLLPPPTPTGVSVPATSNGPIPISWNASPTATRYDVYQSINNGGWTTAYSGASTSVTVTATSTGSYQFFVTANNASGWSGQVASSAVVSVTIPPSSAPGISAPGSSTSGSYTVSWTGVSGASSYTLQEQVNGGGWSAVQTGSATSWSASGKTNATYGYIVQACNAGGCGPWSGTANVSVTLIPPTPTGESVIWASNPWYKPIIKFSWNAAPWATIYHVQESDPNSGGWVDFYDGSNTSVSQLMLVNGTVYFKVQACNSVGCSAWSNPVSITLQSGG